MVKFNILYNDSIMIARKFIAVSKNLFRINTITTRSALSTIKFQFRLRDGTMRDVQAEQGMHILEVAKKYDAQLEGACQASLACSTCHVILPKNVYNQLQPAEDQQQDLLDLAFGLTETSRLGCQVKVDKLFEGTIVEIPKASRNLYVDGSKPSAH